VVAGFPLVIQLSGGIFFSCGFGLIIGENNVFNDILALKLILRTGYAGNFK